MRASAWGHPRVPLAGCWLTPTSRNHAGDSLARGLLFSRLMEHVKELKDFFLNTSLLQDPENTLGLNEGWDPEEKQGEHVKKGRGKERTTNTGKERGRLFHMQGEGGEGKTGGNVGLFDGGIGNGFDMQVLTTTNKVGELEDDNGNKEYGMHNEGKTISVGRNVSEKVPVGGRL